MMARWLFKLSIILGEPATWLEVREYVSLIKFGVGLIVIAVILALLSPY